MGFTLEKVVPWGRSFEEYVSMFRLTASDLEKRILGCGDGPASFNSTLTRQGGQVISLDPTYAFSAAEIQQRIDETYAVVMEQTHRNKDEFVWAQIKSPAALGKIRMDAMSEFLADFPEGKEQGRYVTGALPELSFADRQFDLALCSHFLFLYSEQVSEDFHVQSILELCRVADEVRIFPLLELGAVPSRHVEPVMKRLEDVGCRIRIEPVPYEFQRGGNRMMVITGAMVVPSE